MFVLFVSLGSALLVSGGFPSRGEGKRTGESEWEQNVERGRGGRAASRLSGFKTEVGGQKKKKNLSKDLARSHSPSLSPSLVHSLALRSSVQRRSWRRRKRRRRKRRRRGDCPGAKSRAAHSQPFRKAIEIRRTGRAEAPGAGAPWGPGRPGRRPAAREVAGALPGSGGISMKVVRVRRCAASSWRWAAAASCPGRLARAALAPDAAALGGRSLLPVGRPGRRRRRRSLRVGPGAAASSAAAAGGVAAAAAAAAGAAAAAAAAAASHT